MYPYLMVQVPLRFVINGAISILILLISRSFIAMSLSESLMDIENLWEISVVVFFVFFFFFVVIFFFFFFCPQRIPFGYRRLVGNICLFFLFLVFFFFFFFFSFFFFFFLIQKAH